MSHITDSFAHLQSDVQAALARAQDQMNQKDAQIAALQAQVAQAQADADDAETVASGLDTLSQSVEQAFPAPQPTPPADGQPQQ